MPDNLAALIVVIDFAGVPLNEWNEWYDTEHVPERRALPGFRNGSRWLAADGGTWSLGLYDMDSLDALRTPQYLGIRAEHASAWTKRIHQLRDAQERPSHRYECLQVRPGAMDAPERTNFVHLTRVRVEAGAEEGFDAAADAWIDRLADLPQVSCARRFVALNHDVRLHKHLATVHLEAAPPEVLAELAGVSGLPGVRTDVSLFTSPPASTD